MSKSVGNYIGINEAPSEMFGKIMSISDELMWRYYELLTDSRTEEIAQMRARAESGESNPRHYKVELAKSIISDFHSKAAAEAAEEEFNRIFVRKAAPEEVETCEVEAGTWPLPRLLARVGLAASIAEARRLIEQGGVRIGGERQTDTGVVIGVEPGEETLLQVGKRRFLRVRWT
jgi:tyrosyl-tRNA synthetase